MIITVQKPYDKLLELLAPYKKIFVMGCGDCATICQTGGEQEVREMANRLVESGKVLTGRGTAEVGCDQRLVRLAIRKYEDNFNAADVVLVMSCGSGVQTLTEVSKKMCIPGCDTMFCGTIERIGKFFERCRACGDCILYETGGICPIARCSKELLNGPCGGQDDGKCEVGLWQKDCAWVLIYNRLKEINRLDLLKKFRPPKDYSNLSKYKEQIREGLQ